MIRERLYIDKDENGVITAGLIIHDAAGHQTVYDKLDPGSFTIVSDDDRIADFAPISEGDDEYDGEDE